MVRVFVSKAIVAFANRVCHPSVAFLQYLRSMFNLHNFANPLYRRPPRIKISPGMPQLTAEQCSSAQCSGSRSEKVDADRIQFAIELPGQLFARARVPQVAGRG